MLVKVVIFLFQVLVSCKLIKVLLNNESVVSNYTLFNEFRFFCLFKADQTRHTPRLVRYDPNARHLNQSYGSQHESPKNWSFFEHPLESYLVRQISFLSGFRSKMRLCVCVCVELIFYLNLIITNLLFTHRSALMDVVRMHASNTVSCTAPTCFTSPNRTF